MSRATLALQLKNALSHWIFTFIFVIGFSLQALSQPLVIEIASDGEQVDPSHQLLKELQHTFDQMVSDVHKGTLLFESAQTDMELSGNYVIHFAERSYGLTLSHASWPEHTNVVSPFIPPVKKLITIEKGIKQSTLLSYFQVVFARHLNYSMEELELDLGHVLSEYPADLMPLVFGLAVEQHRIYRQSTITALVPGQLFETYERALALSPATLKAWIHANMADIYAETSRAEGLYYQAMNQFEKSENDRGLVVAGLMLAEHLSDVGRTVAYQQVLTKVKLASGRLGWKNMVLIESPEHPDSIQNVDGAAQFQKAEELAFQAEKSIKAGEWNKAVEYYEQNLELVLNLRIEPAIARAYFQLGTLNFQLNELEKAKEYFIKAADYMEMLADTCGLAKVDNNLGAIYYQTEEWVDAQLRFESALRLEDVCGNPENILRCSVNFGDLRAQQRRWAEAQTYYDRALAIAEQFDNKNLMASILYAKGLTHLKEGLLQIGYKELLQASNISGGNVHGEPEKEQAFLQRLRKLIGEGDPGFDSSALE